jgi:hypothetical protein
MTPGRHALTIYRGDTYRWQFHLWADAAKTVPVDLTDVEVEAEIKTISVTLPLEVVVTELNTIDMLLSAEGSRTLVVGQGAWDLELTYLSGDVATVLAGPVKVIQDVTNSA